MDGEVGVEVEVFGDYEFACHAFHVDFDVFFAAFFAVGDALAAACLHSLFCDFFGGGEFVFGEFDFDHPL